MMDSSRKKVFLVLVLLLFGFGLAGSTVTTLVCPVPPSGEGEGEVPTEGEAEAEVPPEGEEGAGLSDLAVNPGRLILEATATTATVDVTNAGSGTLNWTAVCDKADVTVTPDSGSASTTVTIQGAASLFMGDDSTCAVTFTNADNAEDTAQVSISLLGRGVSTGLRNVPLGTTVYLVAKADETYSTLEVEGVSPEMLAAGLPDVSNPEVSSYAWAPPSAPSESTAALSSKNEARVTIVPDKVGSYTFHCTITQNGIPYPVEETINVSTFAGAINTCSGCHGPGGMTGDDMFTPWSGTKHAHMFEKDIDGLQPELISEECIKCHTVGYDLHRSADNGGFDDAQKDIGWQFPAVLQAGNWDAVPDDLKNLANIQCENCHGPGGDHATSGNTQKIDVSLKEEVCGTCHDEPEYPTTPKEWRLSAHSDATAEAFAAEHMNTNTSCVRCHSGAAYVAKVKGVADADLPLGEQVITCSVCHDPHDATNPSQLRRYGEVDLPPYETDTGGAGVNNFDNVGAGATCMYCHNARRDSASARSTRFPHENTAADMLMGINGVEYGAFVANSSHTTATANDGYCVRCHMADTPAEDEPGSGIVGEHTFAMKHVDDNGTPDDTSDDTTVENIGACTECHPDLTEFNREASGDWDGNGSTEGVKDEVQGLMALVLEQILAKGAVQLDAYPGWDLTAVTAEDLPKVQDAIWNYVFVDMDRSGGIHNTNYTVTLLQRSYKDLAGVDVPGADIR